MTHFVFNYSITNLNIHLNIYFFYQCSDSFQRIVNNEILFSLKICKTTKTYNMLFLNEIIVNYVRTYSIRKIQIQLIFPKFAFFSTNFECTTGFYSKKGQQNVLFVLCILNNNQVMGGHQSFLPKIEKSRSHSALMLF